MVVTVKNIKKVYKVPKKQKELSKLKRLFSWFYREWEEKVAVDDISFEVKPGEILGYLGPNGAGKSTTIKILTGIIHPTEGDVYVFDGLSPFKNRQEYTSQIGAVFGHRTILIYDIPIKDSLEVVRAIYGLSDSFFKKRLKYISKILGVEDLLERPYRLLSLGEKMRCELLAAFIHKPKLVFLDEPTIGLDAQAKINVRKFLKQINKEEGVTIMITTHDMDDIEELCDRIILIDKGNVVYKGSLDLFRKKFASSKKVVIHYKSVKDANLFNKLKRRMKIIDQNNVEFEVKSQLGNLLKDVVECFDIIDMSITEPKLDDVLANMYAK